MALREIGWLVEGLVGLITELISFAVTLTDGLRRCLHDVIAGTVVLRDPQKVLAAPEVGQDGEAAIVGDGGGLGEKPGAAPFALGHVQALPPP